MAIIDVVKCEMPQGILIAKYPSSDLRLGSQLVVHPGQSALFVKGGAICDEFESGTYTLKTDNIPLLNKFINIPFGGNSPFQAEVWFVNKLAVLDAKWGTATPLQIEDPKYEVIVPVRAYGQYGFKVEEPRKMLEALTGNRSTFSSETLGIYFRGKILSQLTTIISNKLIEDQISILNINSHLSDISIYSKGRLMDYFAKYGLSLQTFDIMSISVIENDPSFIKLKEAKDLAARLKITGRDVYQMERSFNVLESAASNEGIAGGIMGVGLGMGAGMAAGNQMSSVASQMNTNPASTNVPPPLPTFNMQYYLAINGIQKGPYNIETIVSAIQDGRITKDHLVWKAGMSNWAKLASLAEFSPYFNVPPPIPMP